MIGIISTVLPVLIKLIGWFIDRASLEEETKRKWLELMDLIEQDLSKSAEHNKDDKTQKDDIDQQWEDKWGKK